MRERERPLSRLDAGSAGQGTGGVGQLLVGFCHFPDKFLVALGASEAEAEPARGGGDGWAAVGADFGEGDAERAAPR